MSEWICTEDRVPATHEGGYLNVLVYSEDEHTCGVEPGIYNRGFFRWNRGDPIIGVTHWMPYPSFPARVLKQQQGDDDNE